MRNRVPVKFFAELAGVLAALVLFALGWLPFIGFFALQPYAVELTFVNLIIGIGLSVALAFERARGLWLLLGIAPAFFVPAWILFALVVACPLGWTTCDL